METCLLKSSDCAATMVEGSDGSTPSETPAIRVARHRDGRRVADRDFRYTYDGLDRLVQAARGAEGGSWSSAVGGQQWALDMLGNWDSIFNDTNGDGNYTSSSPDEERERTHNFANEIEDITSLPFAYDAAGNMTEQGLLAAATKYYTHDAWNRLTEVKIDAAVLGQYEYNALHWRGVKRARSPGAGSLDEMRLMYYSANWQLLEERIDRSWTSGFTEDERAQTFWGKRYIDDAVGRRRDRDANGTWDNNFFYVTDAQFSTVAMALPNAGIVERITYDSYGKARHHFGGDVTGDGAATAAADDAALVTTFGLGSNSIGQANYKAEQDLNRDGTISTADRTTLAALTGGADQAALASGMVSFTTTGSGGSTVHGPDNSIAWDGYVFNAETGQYHVRFRWLDPPLGRWMERDPLRDELGSNGYQYVVSNPPRHLDPSGLKERHVSDPYLQWDPVRQTCSVCFVIYYTPDLLDYINPFQTYPPQTVKCYPLNGVCNQRECTKAFLAEAATRFEGEVMIDAINLQIAQSLGVELAFERLYANSTVTSDGLLLSAGLFVLPASSQLGKGLSEAAKRALAKRLGRIPRSNQPLRQGRFGDGADELNTLWWEYLDEAGNLKMVVPHPDGSVHVGTPKPQSLHRTGQGPPKFYADPNVPTIGECCPKP